MTRLNGTFGEWDEQGHAELRVTAPDLTGALDSALNALIAMSGVELENAPANSRFALLRAESDTPSGLLLDLAVALHEEHATSGGVAGVSIDGVLRTEQGWIAWGRAALDPGRSWPHRIDVLPAPQVRQSAGRADITATVMRSAATQ